MHDLEILRFASIWHHSGLYQTIMMSLKGTLSFFLYNAPHFQRLKSNLAIESLSWQDEVHSFAILIWFASPNEKDLTIFQEWTCLSARDMSKCQSHVSAWWLVKGSYFNYVQKFLAKYSGKLFQVNLETIWLQRRRCKQIVMCDQNVKKWLHWLSLEHLLAALTSCTC